MLQGLGNAVESVPLGQRGQRFGVNNDGVGRVVGTEQIFAAAVVERLLEVQRAVQRAHGRCGDVHELYAAVQHGRQHATEVVGHGAAERDDAGVLADAAGEDLIDEFVEDPSVLGRLGAGLSAGVHGYRRDDELLYFDARLAEPAAHDVAVQPVHDAVSDEVVACGEADVGKHLRRLLPQILQDARLNKDVAAQVFPGALEHVAPRATCAAGARCSGRLLQRVAVGRRTGTTAAVAAVVFVGTVTVVLRGAARGIVG